jgi:hypothetical protein
LDDGFLRQRLCSHYQDIKHSWSRSSVSQLSMARELIGNYKRLDKHRKRDTEEAIPRRLTNASQTFLRTNSWQLWSCSWQRWIGWDGLKLVNMLSECYPQLLQHGPKNRNMHTNHYTQYELKGSICSALKLWCETIPLSFNYVWNSSYIRSIMIGTTGINS